MVVSELCYNRQMSRPVRIWLLRHAESLNIVAGLASSLPAAELTNRGVAQAADAARELSAEPLSAVYASTAVRGVRTAEAIAAVHALEVVQDRRLGEVGIGCLEGSTDSAVHRRTAEVLRAWVVDRQLAERVSDGESGHDVLARLSAAFGNIEDAYSGETVAVVGHVAALTLALAELFGLGSSVWGEPLPHAVPVLHLRGGTWAPWGALDSA